MKTSLLRIIVRIALFVFGVIQDKNKQSQENQDVVDFDDLGSILEIINGGKEEIAKLLRKIFGDNTRTKDGNYALIMTVLEWAAKNGLDALVNILVRHGDNESKIIFDLEGSDKDVAFNALYKGLRMCKESSVNDLSNGKVSVLGLEAGALLEDLRNQNPEKFAEAEKEYEQSITKTYDFTVSEDIIIPVLLEWAAKNGFTSIVSAIVTYQENSKYPKVDFPNGAICAGESVIPNRLNGTHIETKNGVVFEPLPEFSASEKIGKPLVNFPLSDFIKKVDGYWGIHIPEQHKGKSFVYSIKNNMAYIVNKDTIKAFCIYLSFSELTKASGGGDFIIEETMLTLFDAIRQKWGKPLKINSAFRTAHKQEELRVQGFKAAAYSPHQLGWALDIDTTTNEESRKLVALIEATAKELGIQVRIYSEGYWKSKKQTFVHVDVAPHFCGVGRVLEKENLPAPFRIADYKGL